MENSSPLTLQKTTSMPEEDSNTCNIYMNDLDRIDSQSVTLPCGHKFLLTVLAKLRSSESPVCPDCGISFAELVLPALAGLDGESVTSAANDEWLGYWRETDEILCKLHNLPFVNWCEKRKTFHCADCSDRQNFIKSELTLINDAIYLIKRDIASKARWVTKKLTNDLVKHRKVLIEEQFMLEMERIFQNEIQTWKETLRNFMKDIETRIAGRQTQIDLVKKIEANYMTINSEIDIKTMIKFRTILKGLRSSANEEPLKRTETALFKTVYSMIKGTPTPVKILATIGRILGKGTLYFFLISFLVVMWSCLLPAHYSYPSYCPGLAVLFFALVIGVILSILCKLEYDETDVEAKSSLFETELRKFKLYIKLNSTPQT